MTKQHAVLKMRPIESDRTRTEQAKRETQRRKAQRKAKVAR